MIAKLEATTDATLRERIMQLEVENAQLKVGWPTSTGKGVMSRETYRAFLACLHPDRVGPELKQKYTKAFQEFQNLEPALCASPEAEKAASRRRSA